jgi:N-acetyl-gamma-glutamyl-phosphate reductase
VFSCLPHGVSGRYVHAVRAAGRRAVDLSSDFRLSPDAVYGLTEFARPRVAEAELVANPGCYPTAALLSARPPRTDRRFARDRDRHRVGRDGAGQGLSVSCSS